MYSIHSIILILLTRKTYLQNSYLKSFIFPWFFHGFFKEPENAATPKMCKVGHYEKCKKESAVVDITVSNKNTKW